MSRLAPSPAATRRGILRSLGSYVRGRRPELLDSSLDSRWRVAFQPVVDEQERVLPLIHRVLLNQPHAFAGALVGLLNSVVRLNSGTMIACREFRNDRNYPMDSTVRRDVRSSLFLEILAGGQR
jgi:hypothetical protein